jgi:hypothetical protein
MRSSRFERWLRWQSNLLASRQLAVWLLAILVLVLAAYLFLPQQGEVSVRALERWVEQQGLVGRLCRAIGLTNVLHSPFIWGPCALMFVNLLLCMFGRRATLGLCRFPVQPPRAGPSWLHRQVAAADPPLERVAELLREHGYRTLVADGSVYGLRGRFAILGHWLFHAGLLALLVVGTYVAVAPAPFRGVVGIGEGESFDLYSAPFLSTNSPVEPDLPALRFRMEQIDTFTVGSEARRFEARLVTPEGSRASFGINRPYRRAPYQVMLHGFGYMAGWVIVNERGRMLAGTWVKLAPFPHERSDTFSLGDEGSSAHVRLYPDHEREGEKHRSRGYELRNPRFMARIVWRGEKVYNGLLEPGQRLPLRDGLEFFFLPEIRRYGLLEVIQEQAHVALFTCFGSMILGLAIRYLRIRKEILVQRAAGGLEVFGHGEIFESLFAEEFAQLTDALASAISGPEAPAEAGRGAT